MLNYFRFNDPYRLLVMLAIMLVVYLPFFIDTTGLTYPELKSFLVGNKVHNGFALYTEVIDSVAPLSGWFYGLFDILFDDSLLARHIFSFFLIFLQAVFFGLMLIHRKAYQESTFVPALLYGLLFLFSFDTLSLTAELLGLTFLLFALNNLFREIEFRDQGNETILNIGFLIGIASVFEFSFAVYLLASIIILSVYTRSSARKFLLMIVGFFLPHALLLSLYFLKDGVSDVIHYFYLPNLSFISAKYFEVKNSWIFLLAPLTFVFFSLVALNRLSGFTKYQSQLLQVMFFWMVFSFLQIFYSKDFRPQSFITLIPSVSFFISHFLLNIRRRRLGETTLWILLLTVITTTYVSRYFNLINYSQLMVSYPVQGQIEGRKIVVLSDDLKLYVNNEPGTPFLNWKLSQEIFQEPDYYENVIAVYEGFKADPPDVIIDPQKLMRPFFERIPELQKQYKPIPEGYQKR